MPGIYFYTLLQEYPVEIAILPAPRSTLPKLTLIPHKFMLCGELAVVGSQRLQPAWACGAEGCAKPLASRLSITHARPDLTAGLSNLLARAAGLARAEQRPILVSRTTAAPQVDPVAFFQRGSAAGAQLHFWAVPQRGCFLVGVGEAWSFTAEGPERFSTIDTQWRQLLQDAILDPADGASGSPSGNRQPATAGASDNGAWTVTDPTRGPLLMGGFSFDPLRPATERWTGFPDGAMTVPRFQLALTPGGGRLTVNVVVTPDADIDKELEKVQQELASLLPPVAGDGNQAGSAVPALDRKNPSPANPEGLTATDIDAAGWQEAVAEAARWIRQGRLEKVVLAREVIVKADHPLDGVAALAFLIDRYPTCYVFAVARGDRCFLGASPEQLVQLQGTQVRAMGLAGTARRDPGEDRDRELGQALLNNPKEREEHAVVVRFIKAMLEPLCTELDVPGTPTLLRVRNVQHLYTPITGKIARSNTIFDLVARLHPTPAVGGAPRDEALALIRRLESFDRGWYAAPVGWVDKEGNGEFAVAIRSALLRGREASLFAGCGIMGDSDPEAEFQESRYKLRPMLRALAAGDGE